MRRTASTERRTAGADRHRTHTPAPQTADTTGLTDLQQKAGNRAVAGLIAQRSLDLDVDPMAERTKSVNHAHAKRLFLKGQKAYEAGKYLVAADYFARTYEYFPHPHIAFSRAQALRLGGGRVADAIRYYRVYLEAEPSGARAADAREFIDLLVGDAKTGNEKTDNAAAEKAYKAGNAAYRNERFLQAADFFAQAYALMPAPELAFSLAQALRRAGGHRERALQLYEEFVAAMPSHRRAKDARSFIAELTPAATTGDKDTDRAAAEKAFARAQKEYQAGRFLAAADLFGQAHALLPVPEITFSHAQALRRAGGHTDQAIKLYLAFAAARPSHPKAKLARRFVLELSEAGAAL